MEKETRYIQYGAFLFSYLLCCKRCHEFKYVIERPVITPFWTLVHMNDNTEHDSNDTQSLWEGGSVGTSVRGLESQGGARESLKGPLATDIIYFQLKSSILKEVLVCPRGPKAVLIHLAKFLLEALMIPYVLQFRRWSLFPVHITSNTAPPPRDKIIIKVVYIKCFMWSSGNRNIDKK